MMIHPSFATDAPNSAQFIGECRTDLMADAKAGEWCSKGNAKWRLDGVQADGKRVYEDIGSGIKVSSPSPYAIPFNNEDFCAASDSVQWRVARGCPKGKCQDGDSQPIPNDFAALEKDHFSDVIPGVKGASLWAAYEYDDSYFVYSDGSYSDVYCGVADTCTPQRMICISK